MNYLTVGQLLAACNSRKYLIVRFELNEYAINTKIAPMALRRRKAKGDETLVIGLRPCGFQEYISRKTPFQL